jgi:hypothetical protein
VDGGKSTVNSVGGGHADERDFGGEIHRVPSHRELALLAPQPPRATLAGSKAD